MSEDYREYQDAAERIAVEAGALLLEAYGRVSAREKGPADLVTEADFASQRLIARRIAEAFPDHTLLAEEEGARRPITRRPWRWVVDPLDGTMNFAHGFPFWCVSIALEHAGTLVVGVVHNPLTRRDLQRLARPRGDAQRPADPGQRAPTGSAVSLIADGAADRLRRRRRPPDRLSCGGSRRGRTRSGGPGRRP